jgi:hypothetical protein
MECGHYIFKAELSEELKVYIAMARAAGRIPLKLGISAGKEGSMKQFVSSPPVA